MPTAVDGSEAHYWWCHLTPQREGDHELEACEQAASYESWLARPRGPVWKVALDSRGTLSPGTAAAGRGLIRPFCARPGSLGHLHLH